MKRHKIPAKEREAALAGLLMHIRYDHLRQMSADQVLSLIQYHHNIPVAIGGENKHWNLVVMWRRQHQEETAKRTLPMLAKVKRIDKSWRPQPQVTVGEVGDLMFPKPPPKPKSKYRIQSRPFDKRKKAEPRRARRVVEKP